MIDAQDLLLFARVVAAGSFSAAAERVGLPKSTLSRRISALEATLGERLLQRTTRQLHLTDFGAHMLAHAQAVTEQVDDATALAAHRQHQPSGRLRVSMAADMAQHAFGDMLARFVAEYPALTLELDLSPRRVDLVGEGIDVAVRVGALADDASLAARRLGLFTTGLYAAPDYLARHGPITAPTQLAGLHGLITGPLDAEPRPWVLQHADGRRWQGQPATSTRANSPDLPMRLARAGVGVTGLPDFYLEAAAAAGAPPPPGALQRVLPEWALPPVPVWAVFPGRRLLPTRARLFIDALAATAATCRKVVLDAPG